MHIREGDIDGGTHGNGGRHGEADAAAVVSRTVRNAKPGWHADGGGLYLQVRQERRPDQQESWVFCYALNRRERQMGRGSLNTVGPSQAREGPADDGAAS
jgi:hypothetical protein